MTRSVLQEATDAWARVYEGLSQAEINRRVLALTALIRGIASAGFVTPEEFSRENGLDSVRTRELFANLAGLGLEFDEDERIVGAALTTRRTPHSVIIGGRRLYAWCALDTLFIPGLLGEPAEVESTCPVSQTPIRLTVSPDGVTELSPSDAALSVVLPRVESSARETGPASPT